MCGRYAITLPPEMMRDYFGFVDQPNFPPRHDVRPTQPVPVVVADNGERRFVLMRWGFIPGFVKNEKEFPLLINARSETVSEKASFRNAIKRRRCLFIADAFYEWQKLDEKGRKKRPYLIRRPMQGPLALAGIWECWQSRDGSEIDTAAILTTSANALLSAIHDRMPVILDPRNFGAWLSPDTANEDVARLMRPLDDDALELVPIDTVRSDLFD
jgi:putative SOS response-associated peptidase YedK